MPDLACAPGIIHPDVDEGGRIRGPGEAIAGIHHGLVHGRPTCDFANQPLVSLIPGKITSPGDETTIGAGHNIGDAEELMSRSLLVLIQNELLSGQRGVHGGLWGKRVGAQRRTRISDHPHAVVGRVGRAFTPPVKVPEIAFAHGHGHVIKRSMPLHLGGDSLRQSRGGRADLIRPRILRVEVCQDLGIVFVAQPIPTVVEVIAVNVAHAQTELLWGAGREGRFSHGPRLPKPSGIFGLGERGGPRHHSTGP